MSPSINKINALRSFYWQNVLDHLPPLSLSRLLSCGQVQILENETSAKEIEPIELTKRKNQLTRTICSLRDDFRKNGSTLSQQEWIKLFGDYLYGDGVHISSYIRRVLEDSSHLPEIKDLLPQAYGLIIHKNSMEDLLTFLLRRSSGILALPLVHMFNVVNLPEEIKEAFLNQNKMFVKISDDLSELGKNTIFIDGWQQDEENHIFTTERAWELYIQYLIDNHVLILLNPKNKDARLLSI